MVQPLITTLIRRYVLVLPSILGCAIVFALAWPVAADVLTPGATMPEPPLIPYPGGVSFAAARDFPPVGTVRSTMVRTSAGTVDLYLQFSNAATSGATITSLSVNGLGDYATDVYQIANGSAIPRPHPNVVDDFVDGTAMAASATRNRAGTAVVFAYAPGSLAPGSSSRALLIRTNSTSEAPTSGLFLTIASTNGSTTAHIVVPSGATITPGVTAIPTATATLSVAATLTATSPATVPPATATTPAVSATMSLTTLPDATGTGTVTISPTETPAATGTTRVPKSPRSPVTLSPTQAQSTTGTLTEIPTSTQSVMLTPTATPTLAPTQAGSMPSGGRQFSLADQDTGRVTLTWSSGTGQAGYQVSRVTEMGAEVIATLGATATGFTDTVPATLAAACYHLAILGPGSGSFGQSDLLCRVFTPAGGAAPVSHVTITTNESPVVRLSWQSPAVGTPVGYVVVPLGRSPLGILPPHARRQVDLPAGPTCYVVLTLEAASEHLPVTVAGVTSPICAVTGLATAATAR